MQPSMLLKLLRKLTVDVSNLSEYTTVALRVCISIIVIDKLRVEASYVVVLIIAFGENIIILPCRKYIPVIVD